MFQMQFCSFGSVDVSRADVVSIVPSLTVMRQQLHTFVEKILHKPHCNPLNKV